MGFVSLVGKKIFIHPLTGHSLDETGWELWLKQNSNIEHETGMRCFSLPVYLLIMVKTLFLFLPYGMFH